jgi:hypothetical protein
VRTVGVIALVHPHAVLELRLKVIDVKSPVHLLIACLVSTAGCSTIFTMQASTSFTMQAYDGPKLPPDKVATIMSTFDEGFNSSRAVAVRALDGAPVPEPARAVEVLPGWHTMGVTYEDWEGRRRRRGTGGCYLALTAEAGHVYRANGEPIGWNTWHCWVEDTNTKQRTEGRTTPYQ